MKLLHNKNGIHYISEVTSRLSDLEKNMRLQELAWFSDTNRVTVATVNIDTDSGLSIGYIPKIKGRSVKRDPDLFDYEPPFAFETKEEAVRIGKEILASWKETIK